MRLSLENETVINLKKSVLNLNRCEYKISNARLKIAYNQSRGSWVVYKMKIQNKYQISLFKN